MKNRLWDSFFILILAICFLFALSLLPDFSLLKVKKINLLEDIQIKPIDSLSLVAADTTFKKTDSLIAKKEQPILKRKGSKDIEDFGPDNLNFFFESLKNSKSEPVRIAFYGDSFIEGDILVAPFRDTLQTVFGGRGVGYMPITSEVNMFRTSIQHTFSNWETFSVVGSKSEWHPLGMPGLSFNPLEENTVQYKPAYKRQTFRFGKIFYKTKDDFALNVTLNDTLKATYHLSGNDSLQQFQVPTKNFKQVDFSFDDYDHLTLYGAALEDSIGISVDNLSMRSNPGLGLNMISDDMFLQFKKLRNYKLVILQYGLNVVNENDSTGYLGYQQKMTALVTRLKNLFPETSFLLIGVSDRSIKRGNEMATMPGIFVLRDVQRKIAFKSQIAFWDLFESMGGENSMVKYTEATPPLGAKDYTHLTFRGGRKIAKRLADALLKARKK